MPRSSGTPRRRVRPVAAAGLALALGLAGCSGSDGAAGSGAASATPTRGGTLSIDVASTPLCLDPQNNNSNGNTAISRDLVDSLTDQDPATGEIVPWLADSWTVNSDASEYTFKLRQGVTFSDGTTLDAHAVKTAYDGIVALGALSELGLIYMNGYKSSTVLDDYTVRVTFDGPSAQFLQATSTTTLSILSPATYQKTAAQRAAGDVVASGLFVLDSFKAGQEVKLSRRKGYAWGSPLVKNKAEAYLDAISVTYVAEDSVRLGNLTSGTLDIDWPRLPISAADQKLIQAAGGTIIQRSLPGIADIMVPNITDGKPFSELAVRQAFIKAVDLKAYASTVFWDTYPVATSVLDRSTPGYASQADLLAYDLAGAKALLDGAGWTTGPDGYRHKNGQRLTLTYLVAINSPGPQLLQSQLKQAGFDVQIKVVTAGQEVTDEKSGGYDMLESYLTRGDPSVLGAILDTAVVKAPPGINTQDTTTAARVNALFAQGAATTNKTQRATVYGELQKYIIQQGVAFPIYERVQVSGLSSKVHGFAWTSESFLRANDIWKSA
jgi:peptide/nickel transport system substrate-binding protein